MSLTRISLWAMGIGGTIAYVSLGLFTLTLDLQPRWLYALGAVVCFARVAQIWYDLWRALRIFKSRSASSATRRSADSLIADHSRDVKTQVRPPDGDAMTVVRNLRRIQFAQHAFHSASLLGCVLLWGWVYLLARQPGHPDWIDVVLTRLFTACFLVAAGVLAYLITRRCPSCQTAFSWNWMRADILRRTDAGRCANCGIRINAYSF